MSVIALAVLGVVAVVIAVVVIAIQAKGAAQSLKTASLVDRNLNQGEGTGRKTSPMDLLKVLALTKAGNKLEAIKLMREVTGLGLAEAKTAVEQLTTGGSAEVSVSYTSSSTELREPHRAEIADLLRENRKIDAIKRVRELTGLGLKEAKDVVDGFSPDQQ